MNRTLKDCFEQKEFEDLLSRAEQQATIGGEIMFVHNLMSKFSQYGLYMSINDAQIRFLRELAE